jgi:hypothetical protein
LAPLHQKLVLVQRDGRAKMRSYRYASLSLLACRISLLENRGWRFSRASETIF